MKRQRTRAGVAAILSLGLVMTACRGSENEESDGGDTATEETEAVSEATDAATEETEAVSEGTDAATEETEAAAEGTDAATEQTEAASEGTDAATEETEAASEGTDAATDGTEAGSEGTAAAGGDEIALAPEVECPASEDGLSDTAVDLGGTYPLSGPVAAYASIPRGIDAYFQHINEANGGVTFGDGVTRQINWEFLDDQYTPNRSLENVRNLVENQGVWFVFNPLGTPPNLAIRDYMNEQEVPQLYVATGASTWGNDHEEFPWTIGYQPDYESEGIAYANYALEQNPEAKIGILYANDDFGRDYLNGVKEGLGEENADRLVAEVTYETTDATIDSQVSQVLDAGVDTFMLIATPAFAIQGINRVQQLGFEGEKILTSVSSSVGAVMGQVNDGAGEGWVTSVYLKDPSSEEFADDAAMNEAKEILLAAYPDANTDDGFYFFGISVAQMLERTFQSMSSVCRAGVMAAAENIVWEQPPLLREGIGVSTGEGDYFPIQQVQLERWEGDGWVPFGDILDAAELQAEG